MLGILLQMAQQPINGMDVVFGIKDVITIGGGIIATVTAYLTLKFEFKAFKESVVVDLANLNKEIDKDISTIQEEIMNAKRGRHAIKKELTDLIKEKEETAMKRIDKTQEEMKEYVKTTNAEFKEINSKLDKIIGSLDNK